MNRPLTDPVMLERAQKVQEIAQRVEDLPPHALPLSVLVSLEKRLGQRGLLPREPHQPLWFIAETERNTFLWQQGLSLEDAALVDFWVDIYALAERHLTRLEAFNPENPFHDGGFGGEESEDNAVEKERRYIERLTGILGRVESHLVALSRAVNIAIAKEQDEEKPVVMLPWRRPNR